MASHAERLMTQSSISAGHGVLCSDFDFWTGVGSTGPRDLIRGRPYKSHLRLSVFICG